MTPVNEPTLRFIEQHRTDDVRKLALQTSQHSDVDLSFAICQIAGHQAASSKLPSWADIEGIRYPVHLSMEQCSSELTARYKATIPARLIAEGKMSLHPTLCDLTGGFGVDCTTMASCFCHTTYVERMGELCELARHNFPLLGLPHIEVINADAVEYLQNMNEVDMIFIDPARRNRQGGKTVAIADCEPDIEVLEPLLLQKARFVWVKLSPMLDLSLALHTLHHVVEAHVVSVENECKELLLLLGRESAPCADEVSVHCVNLRRNCADSPVFTFCRTDEQVAPCSFSTTPSGYLYEPNASLLKAGAYRSIANRYRLKKLHPNSHLYTSNEHCADFPGRTFRIEGSYGFGKQDLKSLRQALGEAMQANLTVRNFPASVADLRRKLKLREGGSRYLFATTLQGDERRLLLCSKAQIDF